MQTYVHITDQAEPKTHFDLEQNDEGESYLQAILSHLKKGVGLGWGGGEVYNFALSNAGVR